MRYYSITISPTSQSKQFTALTYTTLPQGNTIPDGGALQCDIDIFQTLFHQPSQIASIILHGISFQDLNQSANWNGAQITVAIGMSAGLPFANPFQQGQIINGTIYQSFGNWQGNQVSLNLLIIPSTINPSQDVNLSFNWIKGTTLESAVRTTLGIAYPALTISGSFNANLVYTETQPGQYMNLKTFAQTINTISKQIITDPTYTGVGINVTVGGFNLVDNTVPAQKTTNINFTDLVGNLTWIDIATIQAKLVMRADLNIGDYIIFPTGAPATNTATGFGQLRNLVSFDGKFLINSIRHVGSSRQPSADSWVTIVDCVIPGVIQPPQGQ
jgi:hypothetical protein